MNEIVNDQTVLFLKCIEIGIMMGMFYDLIRIVRKIIPHHNFLVQVEDTIYWICCGLVGFGMLYMHNYGEIRFFVFIGIVLGAILYFITFSLIFMRIATYIIEITKKIIKEVIRLIKIPMKWVRDMVMIPFCFLKNKYVKLKYQQKLRRRKIKRKLYHKKAELKTQIYLKTKKK